MHVCSEIAHMTMLLIDNALAAGLRERLFEFLQSPGWTYGWRSNPSAQGYSFWHKHFAGNIRSDHFNETGKGKQYDCSEELRSSAPPVYEAWLHLQSTALKDHVLQRCYANGTPYGTDGTTHTDSVRPEIFTAVYYPHSEWHADWGGETVVFNSDKTDILSAIYPKPNRLLVFPGVVPHVARGVSRICPVLRITLMFKFEVRWTGTSEQPLH